MLHVVLHPLRQWDIRPKWLSEIFGRDSVRRCVGDALSVREIRSVAAWCRNHQILLFDLGNESMPIKLHHDPEPTLNLTPMIDIVFLLIIFFMAGTKFAEMERQIKVELPTTKNFKALSTIPKQRVVHVNRDHTIMMDGKTYQLNELVTELQRLRRDEQETQVLVRGDRQVPLQQVTNVLTACRQAGLSRMGIGIQAETQRR